MKLLDCINQLGIECLNDVSLNHEIEGVYIGDLLSMVMGKGEENSLWLTVQSHVNAVAVAQMLDFSGIVFVEGQKADISALEKANELNIPLFTTTDDAYTLAKKLAQLGI